MTWFRVDDRLWGHPKWIATPPRARALWITAGSWCAGLSNNGRVPRHVLPMLGGTEKDAAALVSVQLWHTNRAGWEFHDWTDLQPDEATVDALAAKRAEVGAMGNHTRWHVRRNVVVASCPWCDPVANGSQEGIATESPGKESPVPARPDPDKDDGSPQVSSVQLRNASAAHRLTIVGGPDGIA